MTAHDPNFIRSHSGLLGWLGLGSRPAADGPDPKVASTAPERQATPQQRQVGEIGTFLGAHKLPVSAQTLIIAWNYLSGADSQVVRTIDRQLQQRLPVTAEWLEEVLGGANADDVSQLADLMQRLESSIDEFAKTSHDAHSATSQYHSALEEHVGELEQVTKAGEVISELASIAKVMMRRTREIEKRILSFLESVGESNPFETLNKVIQYNEYSVEAGIFGYSQVSNADIIALPTQGRQGLAHFFSGSIGEDVVNHSDLPVMTFKV